MLLLDPYGRSPPFTPLGALGSGAFGGLGSPTLGQFHNFPQSQTYKADLEQYLYVYV